MLLDLIENRYSVRKYSDKTISDDDLNKILKAGYLAPSWMNSQPWKFILVKNPKTKKLLSELASNMPHVANCSAVVVCIADKNAWDKEVFGEVLKQRGMSQDGIDKILTIPKFYPKLLGDEILLLRTVEQVTYAVSYMMLEAKDLGIDSCIIGAVSNEATTLKSETSKPEIVEKVNKALNLKEGEVIITLLTLGYNSEKEAPKKLRKDFNEVVYFEKIWENFRLKL